MSTKEAKTPTLEGLDPEAVECGFNPEVEDKMLGANYEIRKFVYTTRDEAVARLDELIDCFYLLSSPTIHDTLRQEEMVFHEIKKAMMVYKSMYKDPTLQCEVNAKRDEIEFLLVNLYKALNLKPLSYSLTNTTIEEKMEMLLQLKDAERALEEEEENEVPGGTNEMGVQFHSKGLKNPLDIFDNLMSAVQESPENFQKFNNSTFEILIKPRIQLKKNFAEIYWCLKEIKKGDGVKEEEIANPEQASQANAALERSHLVEGLEKVNLDG